VDVAILALIAVAAAHSVNAAIGEDSGDIVIPSPSTDFDSGGILVVLALSRVGMLCLLTLFAVKGSRRDLFPRGGGEGDCLLTVVELVLELAFIVTVVLVSTKAVWSCMGSIREEAEPKTEYD
jgi:hypothetical protein